MNSALFHRCRMWASEAKTLLPFHWVELHINALAPQHYLTFSYDSNPLTIIEGIHQLLAAHMLVIEQGGDPRVSPRWQLAFKPKEDNDCYS